MRRLELRRVRVCGRCGRGRAELESDAGDRLVVPLDPPRASALERLAPSDGGSGAPTGTLAEFVLTQLGRSGACPTDVVLDHGPAGLRAVLSFRRGDATDVLICTAQEGVELAVRGGLSMYADDDALTCDGRQPAEPAGRHTVH